MTRGIGVAVADTLLWEKHRPPSLDGVYGLLQPLVRAGVPVSACVMERCADPAYLSRFRVIVLSYEAWKPADAGAGAALGTGGHARLAGHP